MSASRPPLASERVDGLNKGLPKPEMGPPNGPFTWDHPMGVAPRTGEDNLAYWLYGCRVSLLIATIATVFASLVGVVIGLLAGFLGGRSTRCCRSSSTCSSRSRSCWPR